jgi:hypothetical protein
VATTEKVAEPATLIVCETGAVVIAGATPPPELDELLLDEDDEELEEELEDEELDEDELELELLELDELLLLDEEEPTFTVNVAALLVVTPTVLVNVTV